MKQKAPTRNAAGLARTMLNAEVERLAWLTRTQPAQSYTSVSETTGKSRVIYSDEAEYILSVRGQA